MSFRLHRQFKLIPLVIFLSGFNPISAQSESSPDSESFITFHIDSSHSSVEFEVPFMGITRVSGRFDRFLGTITYDPENISRSSVEFAVDSSSVNTAHQGRDADLLSSGFFDAETHPGIFFSSDHIEESGGGWIASGALTMKGISQPIKVPFEILGEHKDDKGHEMGVEVGPVILSRSRFGIGELSKLSADRLLIGDEVAVEILLRLRALSAERMKWIDENPEIPLSRELAASYEGAFSSVDQTEKTDVRFLGDRLTMVYNGKLYSLSPIGENRFRTINLQALVEFSVKDSRATGFVLQREGRPGWELRRDSPEEAE